MNRVNVCAEIRYGATQSDICPPSHSAMFSDDYRQLLHDCLDEWLDRSGGDGRFFIGNADTYNL